ncbi:MAG: DNA repair protein RecO [Candidatus Margulisiibacteriota bacterium]|nr:DNA repair protein RecO [Candidatus Margulisiibacteriota bacterium]
MPLYKAKGIVLGSKPFEETGKLVHLFTREHGKMKLIAKGSRRPGSRFGGRLEPMNYCEVLAAAGRNMDILSQIETIESFQQVRDDPATLNMGLYLVGIVGAATEFGQKNPELFKLLLMSLDKLKKKEGRDRVERFFELNFLKVEGIYKPNADPKMMISDHVNRDVAAWRV